MRVEILPFAVLTVFLFGCSDSSSSDDIPCHQDRPYLFSEADHPEWSCQEYYEWCKDSPDGPVQTEITMLKNDYDCCANGNCMYVNSLWPTYEMNGETYTNIVEHYCVYDNIVPFGKDISTVIDGNHAYEHYASTLTQEGINQIISSRCSKYIK